MKRVATAILLLLWAASAARAGGQSAFTVRQLDDLAFHQHLGVALPLAYSRGRFGNTPIPSLIA